MPGTSKTNSKDTTPRPTQALRRRPDPAAVAKLFDEWMHDDEAEQRETFDFLRNALDEGRPDGYKLFS